MNDTISKIHRALGNIATRPAGDGYLGKGDGSGIIVVDVSKRTLWVQANKGEPPTPVPLVEEISILPYIGVHTELDGVRVSLGYPPRSDVLHITGHDRGEGLAAVGGITPSEQLMSKTQFPDTGSIIELRLNPNKPADTEIYINSGWYKDVDGNPAFWEGDSTVDLLTDAIAALSAGEHQMAVVYIDNATGEPAIITNAAEPGDINDKQVFDTTTIVEMAHAAGEVLTGAVHLYYGQATITENDIYRSSAARIVFAATGTDSGSSAITVTTTDPTITDDSSSGYERGSVWFNEASGTLFVCTDATIGAAVWDTVAIALASLALGVLSVGTAAVGFGDSIMNGALASDAAHEYITLLETAKNWTITNNAVSGSMAADQADAIYTSPVDVDTISLYALGANDERLYASANQKLDFQSIQLAQLAYLAIPDTQKIFGTNTTAITYSGTWTNTSAYGLGKVSNTNGNTATFSIYGSNIIIGSIAFGSDQGIAGTFTITVDGVLYDTYESYFLSVITTDLGVDFAPYAIIIPNLEEKQHTVVMTVTSSTNVNNPVFLDWIASTRIALHDTGPYVYVSNVTRQSAAGYIANGGSEANVTAFNVIIKANASLLAALGLNVALVDAANVIDPLTDLNIDGIHPNDAGHAKLAQAFQAAMNSVSYAKDRQAAAYPAFTRLDVKEGVTPLALPAPGYQSLFVDPADNHLKRVNAAGTVVDIEATPAPVTAGIYAPMVTGTTPGPEAMATGDGQFIMVLIG